MANGTDQRDIYELILTGEVRATERHVQIVERLAALEGQRHQSPCPELKAHIVEHGESAKSTARVIFEGVVQIGVGIVIALLLFKLKM